MRAAPLICGTLDWKQLFDLLVLYENVLDWK